MKTSLDDMLAESADGLITEELAEEFLAMATKFVKKKWHNSLTYQDDMIEDAVNACINYVEYYLDNLDKFGFSYSFFMGVINRSVHGTIDKKKNLNFLEGAARSFEIEAEAEFWAEAKNALSKEDWSLEAMEKANAITKTKLKDTTHGIETLSIWDGINDTKVNTTEDGEWVVDHEKHDEWE